MPIIILIGTLEALLKKSSTRWQWLTYEKNIMFSPKVKHIKRFIAIEVWIQMAKEFDILDNSGSKWPDNNGLVSIIVGVRDMARTIGYWRHKNAKGRWRQYRVPDLVKLDEPPSFARASSRKGPLRCWFSRDAVARFGATPVEYGRSPGKTGAAEGRGGLGYGSNGGLVRGSLDRDYTSDDKPPGKSSKNWLAAPVWLSFPGAL